MSKQLLKALPELLEERVISSDIAGNIQAYYRQKAESQPNRLFVIFGILGSLLVGLGIILILAHNWSHLPPVAQLILAFVPPIIGIIVCFYSLQFRNDSDAWKESSAIFLFLGVGACLAMLSQYYHLQEDVADFVFRWMLLVFPLMYIMSSGISAVLYLAGITFLGMSWGLSNDTSWPYWLMFLAALPFYLINQKKNPDTNFQRVLHYLFPLSAFLGTIGILGPISGHITFMVLMALYGCYVLIGRSSWVEKSKSERNGFIIQSSIGMTVILLISSFRDFWDDQYQVKDLIGTSLLDSPALILLFVFGMLFVLVYFFNQKDEVKDDDPIQIMVFPAYAVLFLLAPSAPMIVAILVNILLFALGIIKIREGVRLQHFGTLNYGLVILTALIACRFFDMEMSLILRGMAFVTIGIGFFAGNYVMYRRIKTQQELQHESA
ncbi:MAG: DUF2157 domain-containing protein [Bacteroidota bacterium]